MAKALKLASGRVKEFGSTDSVPDRISDITPSGGAATIDWSTTDIARVTLNAATVTLTLTGAVNGQKCVIELIQDSTGGRVVVWPSTVGYDSGIDSIAIRTGPNQRTSVGFIYRSSDTKYEVIGSSAEGLRPVGKNAIINGRLDHWQRGTSFAAIASGAYSADRWGYAKTGAMVHTVSRDTDVPTVAQCGQLLNYSLRANLTTADTSLAASDICYLYQRVEGYNWLPLAQRSTTLSFWVKATLAGTYCVSLRNSNSDRSCVAEYTISAANTWERKTVTFSASPSAGTWDYTTGIGATLSFTLASGTTYHTTAGAWQSGAYLTTANQVNGVNTGATDFRIAMVQVEPGSVATDFENRSFGEELLLCQRYYQKLSAAGRFGVGQCYSTTSGEVHLWLPTSMRSAANVTFSAASTFVVFSAAGSNITVTAISPVSSDLYHHGFSINTASGLAGGDGLVLYNSGSASIEFSSEL